MSAYTYLEQVLQHIDDNYLAEAHTVLANRSVEIKAEIEAAVAADEA